jgi:MFS superfamily sulfate permease-like transporter
MFDFFSQHETLQLWLSHLFFVNSFIPKMAFSSLLILAAMDLMIEWFVKPYRRSTDKAEWLVVPSIIIFAFSVGLLPAVALGVALSTFFFVAAFYRSGVVKFIANGLTVHSTIGRNVFDGECE